MLLAYIRLLVDEVILAFDVCAGAILFALLASKGADPAGFWWVGLTFYAA